MCADSKDRVVVGVGRVCVRVCVCVGAGGVTLIAWFWKAGEGRQARQACLGNIGLQA